MRIGPIAALSALVAMMGATDARAQDAAVRIEYRAPEGCPDQTAFFEELGRRMRRARFAAPDQIARTLHVTILALPKGRYRARVEFTDSDGRKVAREVEGENCVEAADGIALITALAIDARANEVEERTAASAAKPGGAPAAPRARQTSAQNPSAQAQPESTLHWDAGIELIATSAAAPELLFGIAGFAGVGFGRTGPSLRLTAARAPSSEIELGEERASFELTFARAEACPLSFAISERFAVEPCAALDLGLLVGKGEPSSVITNPETAEVFWFCANALGRLRLNLDQFLLFELTTEIGVPRSRAFLLNGREVYAIPAVRF